MFKREKNNKKIENSHDPIKNFYDVIRKFGIKDEELKNAQGTLINNAIVLNDIRYAIALIEKEIGERRHLMVGNGVDIKPLYAKDEQKRNPLHLAALCDHVQCRKTSKLRLKLISLLFDEGVDPNSQDISGNTPLHNTLSIRSDNELCFISALLMVKTNLELKNAQGQTFLHLAVMNGHTLIAKMLTTQKGDFSIENENGTNIYELIRSDNMKELHNIFMKNSKEYRGYHIFSSTKEQGFIPIQNSKTVNSEIRNSQNNSMIKFPSFKEILKSKEDEQINRADIKLILMLPPENYKKRKNTPINYISEGMSCLSVSRKKPKHSYVKRIDEEKEDRTKEYGVGE